MSQKIAVVTGSNKGIGFAIVKGLCEKYDGSVYLTSRDIGLGKAAVDEIKGLGLNPLYHQLDITDQKSVDKFRDHLVKTHGGIDILINNAAIAFKHDSTVSFDQQAKETIQVNYYGSLRVCEALFPLLRKNGRVVNVSSSAGKLNKLPGVEVKAKFSDPNLTIPNLNKLMEKFIRDAKDNKYKEEGWGSSCYSVSKVGLCALSIIQQRIFDKEKPNRNIILNSVHPGYVDTDLTSHKGPLTIEEGAKSSLFAAMDADFKGKYIWQDCTIVDWYDDSSPAI